MALNILNIFSSFNNRLMQMHYLHFTKEETEAQTGQIICTRLNSWKRHDLHSEVWQQTTVPCFQKHSLVIYMTIAIPGGGHIRLRHTWPWGYKGFWKTVYYSSSCFHSFYHLLPDAFCLLLNLHHNMLISRINLSVFF